ncbi:fimbria/pilus periplasmic chaperone [Lelliottia amnigena]|uniref:fimbria/pilus periplasmic chaperone n=1 Tax=Lelliottia amnigena TaxID=61646 RepID=UPI001F3E15BB|nr:fimbria/pilus periplasmic chaperone [Lelliottia amnigena]
MKPVIITSSSYYCFLTALLFSLLWSIRSFASSVILGVKRVIYRQSQKHTSTDLINQQGVKPSVFFINPPLWVLQLSKMNVLRIIYVGQIPLQYKESVFYLNNKAIPSTENKMQGMNNPPSDQTLDDYGAVTPVFTCKA